MNQTMEIVDRIDEVMGNTAHDCAQETSAGQSLRPDRDHVVRAAERRAVPRWPVKVPVVAIPVLPDGAPDGAHRAAGEALDLSPEGIRLHLHGSGDLQTRGAVLLFRDPAGAARCAGLEVCNTRPSEAGGLHVGGRFGGFANELLRDENLTPAYCPKRLTFNLGFPDAILSQWADLGVLRPMVCDRVQLCPLCGGLPTFRRGCPTCGSARLLSEPLLHHFACAHVDHLRAFEGEDGLVCPKCRTRRLVVGTDYEHLQGPFRCQDCNGSESELEYIGQCLCCSFRFPGFQSRDLELRGYRAHRLDPLAFRPASGAAAGPVAGPAAARWAPLRPEQDRALPLGRG